MMSPHLREAAGKRKGGAGREAGRAPGPLSRENAGVPQLCRDIDCRDRAEQHPINRESG